MLQYIKWNDSKEVKEENDTIFDNVRVRVSYFLYMTFIFLIY